MKKFRIGIYILAVIVLCVSLAACKDTVAPSGEETVSADKAKEIAISHFGLSEGDCSGIHVEYDDGRYEVGFYADGMEYDVEIDPKNGKVLGADVDAEDDLYRPDDTTRESTPAVENKPSGNDVSEEITEERAKSIVLVHFGISGDDCTYIHAYPDDGDWKVELLFDGIEYEAEVDRRTGDVREADVDRGPVHSGADTETQSPAEIISLERAKEIVCEHFGIEIADCTFTTARLDGREYEIELICGGLEYEAEVNAYTAKVTDSDVDRD